MPDVGGSHAANGGNMVDKDALWVNPSHVTMLHLQAQFARAIHDGIDGILHVRFYLTNWSSADPLKWAQKCADELNAIRGDARGTFSLAGLPRVVVSPANEQNLTDEGGGKTQDWYVRINDWNLAWAREFKRITGWSKDRLMYPALCQGQNEEMFGYGLLESSVAEYGVLGVHGYWYTPVQISDPNYGARYVYANRAYPDIPIFVSECGNFAITRSTTVDEFRAYFTQIEQVPYIIGATPFIRTDPTQSFKTNDWSKNGALIDWMRNRKRTPHAVVIAPTPIPITPPGDEPMPAPFSVGPGIANLMKVHGDTPQSNEWYPTGDDWCFAFGEFGQYTYLKTTNTTYFTPFESVQS